MAEITAAENDPDTGDMPEAIDPTALSLSPVHRVGRRLRWTTANVDEGLPGTVTPLTWSLYYPPTEQTMRDCWVDLGVLPERHREIPDEVDERFLSVAYGHAIANVDNMGQMAARIPGGSAAMMEEQLFGAVQDGGLPEPRGWSKIRRYPMVAVRFPMAVRRAIATFGPLAEETAQWWRHATHTAADADLAESIDLLVAARDMFERGLAVHMVLSMLAQGLMGQLETLAIRAGLESGNDLIKSPTGTAELELVGDLWRLSRAEISLDDFLAEHGFHGPREGLVDSVVWREAPEPVIALAAQYRTRPDGEQIDALLRRRRREHDIAVARLDAGLDPVRRGLAHLLIRIAAQVPIWRETGRVNILRGVDVARAATRSVGRNLVRLGVLADESDVFFLTIDELAAGWTDDHAQLIRRRRVDHAAFDRLALPHVWHGVPRPERIDRAAGGEPTVDPDGIGTTLVGLGVSTGIAEGVVRVVLDLDGDEIPDGTVLVCKATDPGWAAMFPLAAAVVTDVGSAMSHAAIVCRELGLPCVANTRTGTHDLRDGMRVRVDGGSGVITILAAA